MNNIKSIIIKGGNTDKYLCINAILQVCLLCYTTIYIYIYIYILYIYIYIYIYIHIFYNKRVFRCEITSSPYLSAP